MILIIKPFLGFTDLIFIIGIKIKIAIIGDTKNRRTKHIIKLGILNYEIKERKFFFLHSNKSIGKLVCTYLN